MNEWQITSEVIAWYEDLFEQVTQDAEAGVAINNLQMRPHYLSAEESLAYDTESYDKFKSIADSVE